MALFLAAVSLASLPACSIGPVSEDLAEPFGSAQMQGVETQRSPNAGMRVESLPDIVGMLVEEIPYDEAVERLGGDPGVFAYGEWSGVTIEPGTDMEGGVKKMTVTFWASDFEATFDDRGKGACRTKVPSFFAIENDGRLEVRSNSSNAKTLELRANGQEFEVEADLGEVETINVGDYSCPALTESQIEELERRCFSAGGNLDSIEEFGRKEAVDLLVELGIHEDELEETGAAHYTSHLKDAVDEACFNLASTEEDPSVSPSGIVSAPASLSKGYRWTGRLAVGYKVLDIEVDASTSANVSLQSASGEAYILVPDQYRFSPQGQRVTVVIACEQ